MPLDLESWHLEEPLPSPSEQLDQLIILVGDNQPSPAEWAALEAPVIAAWIGAIITPPSFDAGWIAALSTQSSSEAGLDWLLEQQQTLEFLEKGDAKNETLVLRLNMAGWLRYGKLKQGHAESRKVLMAMKFGDAELNQVVKSCFSPAVSRAGFELRTIIENQPAGLIDDQLRVALQTSRFVVADLRVCPRTSCLNA